LIADQPNYRRRHHRQLANSSTTIETAVDKGHDDERGTMANVGRLHPLSTTMSGCRRGMIWLGFATVGLLGVPLAATAQFDFDKLPFTDSERMFEQFFGEDTAADREALRKIDVSIEEERRLGGQILEQGLAALKAEGISVESKGRDVDYLQSLVETLQPSMTHPDRYKTIKVLFARSPRCDARSCPGGTLIFFEGLLDTAGSEAALAGIVGHELSHLDRGHQLLPIKRMKMMEQTFAKSGKEPDPEQFFKSGPMMIKLMARPFRPEDERDADRDGTAWAFAAGYDPREMAKLFQRLGEKAKEPEVENALWLTYFRTHPFSRDRGRDIQKQFAKLKKQHSGQELFIGKENLQRRKSRKQMADEKE
jgi:hypothetical protein